MKTEISFDEWNRWAKNLGADQPFKSYEPQELWWPLSTSINEWDYDFHRLMLADRIRMTAYQKAIEAAVAKRAAVGPTSITPEPLPLRVLDIGCGTGILMRFVADAWKTLPEDHKSKWAGIRIYGVERDPQIAMSAYELLGDPRNPFGSILWRPEARKYPICDCSAVVLTCRSDVLPQKLHELQTILKKFDALSLPTDQELAPVFDIIISETIGGIGDDEDIVRILEHAVRTLAAEGCYLIPQKIESHIAPVVLPMNPSTGLRMLWSTDWRSAIRSINSERYDPSRLLDPRNIMWDTIVPNDCCGLDLTVGDWTFDSQQIRSVRPDSATSYAKSGSFVVNRKADQVQSGYAGWFVGFKGWFVATLFDATILTTAGSATSGSKRTSSDCWKHRFAPVDGPIAIKPGDVIAVIFGRQENDQSVEAYTYRWRGRVLRKGSLIDRFDQQFLLRGPSGSPRQHAAPRPLSRRTLDYLLAMLLALLTGLLVETAIETFGSRRWKQAPQTFLLFAVSINLLRVAHSAFVLAEDRVFHDEGIESESRNRVVAMFRGIRRIFERFRIPAQVYPTMIVALGVVMLLLRDLVESYQAALVLGYAGICSLLLFFWDRLPWWRFRSYLKSRVEDLEKSKIADPRVKDAVLLGKIMNRQRIIKEVLDGWMFADALFFVAALVYLVSVYCWPLHETTIDKWEFFFGASLLIGCAFDWLMHWDFYYQSMEYETKDCDSAIS